MTPLPIITPSQDTHHSHSPNIDQSHRNIPANTHKEVDDWFHHVFTQQSQTIPQTHPDNIQSFTNNPPSLSDSLSQTADPVSATDVELSINSRLLHASHSSPGHDHITYQLIKHAPEQLTTLLTKLYNSSLFLGYLPSSAKTSHITVIPKPHLDHKLPKNFRPLSLTPSIWKVLEGILHSRIMHHMENNHLINNSQFGFRQDHSTTDAVLTMLHKILNNKASNRHSLGFFADISKAFDKVCIKSLMYKINLLKFPLLVSRWIYHFLTNRTSFVKHFGSLSNPFHPLAGIPQGSILAPLLFLIYVNDIPVTPYVYSSQFADDTAAVSTSLRRNTAAEHMQTFINAFTIWADSWKITLHPDKSCLISFFHKNKTHLTNIIAQNFTGEPHIIPYTSVHRYLGILIDSNLKFSHHIARIKSEATKRFHIICRLYRFAPDINPRIMIHLYKTYIRPLMDYCAPIFLLSPLSSSYHLEVLQNNILRHILNVPRITPLREIRSLSSCTSLKERWNHLTVTYILNKSKLDLPISHLILEQIFSPTSRIFELISTLIQTSAPEELHLPALRHALNHIN